MFNSDVYLNALFCMSLFALYGWIVSVIKKNVTIVDSMWGLFFAIASYVYLFSSAQEISKRAAITGILVSVWSLRLSVYLFFRNLNHEEDRRYQKIRSNNQPYFWLKSIYIVFGLQVLLAWIISLPLHGAILSKAILNYSDYAGILLWTLGLLWETTGDYQLSRFKSRPENKGKVLNTGLWRYSRHPNYFGEACVWWGYYLIAVAGGAWWSVPGPLLMTFLLLKVSGVSLLEKDISERRPEYSEYIRNTSAFIPWLPKKI